MASLIDKYFSAYDLEALTKAITAAESKTSGELAVQIAPASKNWLFERLTIATVLSIVAFLISLWFTRDTNWGNFFNFTQATLYAMIAFVVGYFGTLFLLQNRERKRKLVWNRAVAQFAQLTPTTGQTGVLVLLSLEEHQAAVVADQAIAQKVAPDYWQKPVGLIVEGMKSSRHCEGLIAAVTEIGTTLAAHFPRSGDDVNEFPDAPTLLR
uniref:Membrane protein n=1 Tax=uncultured bacterium pAW1 TaxID=1781155 RepID=A0A1C9U4P7_9BACT|nr:membrane protein [uncultured bacterium pAW1]